MSKKMCLLLACLLLLAGCTESTGSSSSSLESSLLSNMGNNATSQVENKIIQVNDDISVEFLQQDILALFDNPGATNQTYQRIQHIGDSLYYLSTVGTKSSVMKYSLADGTSEVYFDSDKRFSDFAMTDEGMIIANVIEPIDDFDLPAPDYPLGMYIYSPKDNLFIPAIEYFEIREGIASFKAYTAEHIYFTVKDENRKTLYRTAGAGVEEIFQVDALHYFSIVGNDIIYVEDGDDVVYLLKDIPVPLFKFHSNNKKCRVRFSGENLILSSTMDNSGYEYFYANIDLHEQELVETMTLLSSTPKDVQAYSYISFAQDHEHVGGSTRVIESSLTIFTWNKELIRRYPPFDNPNSITTTCCVLIDELLYYVDMGTSPSTLKVLYPLEETSEAA